MAEKSESKKSAAVEPKEEGKPSTERTRAVDAAIPPLKSSSVAERS